MTALKKLSAVRIDAPSPLVGEGITASPRELGGVGGSICDPTLPREPLTRLRFAIADASASASLKERRPEAAYASPTRGEGKKRAPHTSWLT
jgi:hypothetical protein